jgi:uncharacterized membrane protein
MTTTSNNSGDYKSVSLLDINVISNEQFEEYENLKKQKKVSYKRHIAKAISYRIISTSIGISVVWLISGSFEIGTAFGVAELVYKPLQYYIHERVWYKWIKYGLINKK